MYKFLDIYCSCPSETPLVDCTDKATSEAKKTSRCGLLDSQNGLFKEAFKAGIDLSGFYSSCVFDVCENPDTSLHCPILEEAVFFGSQNGVRIDLSEWRVVTNCRKYGLPVNVILKCVLFPLFFSW